jgi:hypothetical protein
MRRTARDQACEHQAAAYHGTHSHNASLPDRLTDRAEHKAPHPEWSGEDRPLSLLILYNRDESLKLYFEIDSAGLGSIEMGAENVY